jgi:hypothetical protein
VKFLAKILASRKFLAKFIGFQHDSLPNQGILVDSLHPESQGILKSPKFLAIFLALLGRGRAATTSPLPTMKRRFY